MGAGLSGLMATEAAHGLDPVLRVAMRQDLWLVSPTHNRRPTTYGDDPVPA